MFTHVTGRTVRFAEYEVDFTRRELRRRGIRIALPKKPFQVLELLLTRPGEVVTRQELFQFLWPDSHVSYEHSLNSAVNSLRQALGDSSSGEEIISTRPGFGYLFKAPVHELEGSARPSRDREKNRDAFEDYIKGRYLLDRLVEEDTYKAIAFFKSAADDATCSGLAHSGIADAYSQLASLGWARPSAVAEYARSSAELALANDAGAPEVHISSARVKMIFDWKWENAEQAANRALTLDPGSVSANVFQAALLCGLGRYTTASEVCVKALQLDPLSFPANLQRAACLYTERNYGCAIDQCWRLLTLAPRFAPAQILLALAYEQVQMREEAYVEFENAHSCLGFEAPAASGMGRLLATIGREPETERWRRELSRQAQTRYVSPYLQAVVCLALGDKTQAFSYLEESVDERDPTLLGLNADARFDSVRGDERFQSILAQIGVA